MAWSMEGTFFENCSCDAICPCTWSNMTLPATHDYCRAALAFSVERGEVEGTDISGRRLVLVLLTPPMMLEGGWKVGAFVDHDTDDAQLAAFTRVISGELGGPPAALGPLIAEFLGIERAPITITSDGKRHHVEVGDVIDFTNEQMLTGSGDRVELTNIVVHPAGPTLAVAPASAKNAPFGAAWQGEGLSGFSNRFSWAA